MKVASAVHSCGLKTGVTLLSALFSMPLMAEVVRLKPAASPADNPLKGLVPYADYADKPGHDARDWKATLDLPKEPVAGLTLALRVIHPLPNGKPLRFANAEQDRHAPGWLSLGTLPR